MLLNICGYKNNRLIFEAWSSVVLFATGDIIFKWRKIHTKKCWSSRTILVCVNNL